MKILLKSLMLVLMVLLFPPSGLSQSHSAVNLTILHLNDMHGHILPFLEKSISEKSPSGGGAYLSHMVRAEIDKNPDGAILLAAGDMFQGTPVSNVFRGQPVIELMNYLRFDAMVLGNHEFDWGQEVLNQLKSSADFPFLAANISGRDGNAFTGTKPYIILNKQGLRIAVIGLTTPETPYSTKHGNTQGLAFHDPVRVLPRVIKEVKRQGAMTIVVLSHLGLDADRRLARRVRGIDVIVGGHSHTVVADPVLERGTVIVQAGFHGLYLGALDLRIDSSTGKIISYTREKELKPVLVGLDAPSDERAARIIEMYNEKVKTEFSKVIGVTTVDLTRQSLNESNLGNIVTDAIREATGADIAIQNGGGIRMDVPKGDITMEDVFSVLPFDNLLVTMDLTGKQILRILEHNVAKQAKILQLSGMKVVYDLRRPPSTSKIAEAYVGDKVLAPKKIYRVTTNDFLAAGGDQFSPFKDGKNVVYGDDVREAFVTYIKKHSPVSPKVQDRIRFVE